MLGNKASCLDLPAAHAAHGTADALAPVNRAMAACSAFRFLV